MNKVRTDIPPPDKDTMRPEYDFSEAKRGVTARRYAEGANVVVVSPEALDSSLPYSSMNCVRL